MANAGGPAPQNAPQPKKELTDEQKRTFTLLGVMGFLAVVVAIIYVPGMLRGGTEALPQAPSAPAELAPGTTPPPGSMPPGGASAAVPGAPGGEAIAAAPGGGAPATPGTPGVVTVAAVGGIGQNSYGIPPSHRSDPFVNFVKAAPYLPPPPEPIQVPPPTVITIERPVSALDRANLNLPTVRIPRFAEQTTAPRDAIIPTRVQGGSQPQPSYDKRLSGVVISNGVRALLEINNGIDIRTYVVQPGDSVEGITVLNIQRTTEGGRTLTRMLIREAGQEKYVDLKPGPPRADPTMGGGLDGGMMPGGMPGAMPGAFGP